MADFNSLVADVFTITNRPDLIAETQLAVKSATLQLHRQDYFYKDLIETVLEFSTSDYLQTVDYRSLFPRFRSLKYLRKYDPTKVLTSQATSPSCYDAEGVGEFFRILTPDQVLDSYKLQYVDVCYMAGSLIQIKSRGKVEFAIIGLYQNPVVASPDTYSSWISDEARYAIVYTAASIVFAAVLNNPQKAAANNSLAQLEFAEVKNSNIIAEGY